MALKRRPVSEGETRLRLHMQRPGEALAGGEAKAIGPLLHVLDGLDRCYAMASFPGKKPSVARRGQSTGRPMSRSAAINPRGRRGTEFFRNPFRCKPFISNDRRSQTEANGNRKHAVSADVGAPRRLGSGERKAPPLEELRKNEKVTTFGAQPLEIMESEPNPPRAHTPLRTMRRPEAQRE
jgi:hypothetical protein